MAKPFDVINIPCPTCPTREECEVRPRIEGDSDREAVEALADCPEYVKQMEGNRAERELAAAILAFTRARAIVPGDTETNRLHERDTWTAIEREFADQYPGDLLDLLDDYAAAILAAMYRDEDPTAQLAAMLRGEPAKCCMCGKGFDLPTDGPATATLHGDKPRPVCPDCGAKHIPDHARIMDIHRKAGQAGGDAETT